MVETGLALLHNLSPHLRDVHAIAADRLVRTFLMLLKRMGPAVAAAADKSVPGAQVVMEIAAAPNLPQLLWLSAGVFDGMLLSDTAMRRNAELM